MFGGFTDVPTAVVHGDPGPADIRVGSDGSVGLLDWDESRDDLTWHDLSNLGVQVLGDANHHRARRLSNGWAAEPDYARRRFGPLGRR